MPAESREAWSRAQRSLHWWTASLVLLAFVIAWIMVGLPLSQLLLKFGLYQLHKSAGIFVLALTLLRLVLRSRRGRPAWDADLPRSQKRAASTVHVLLYALLLATPVLGYFAAATAPARVPTLFLGLISIPHLTAPDPVWFGIVRQVHRVAAILLVLLACGHGLAAIHHHLRGRPTLTRMWGRRGATKLARYNGATRDRHRPAPSGGTAP
jgi:cytochrome b561